MEVECLTLKDLTGLGESFAVDSKEDGSQGEKVSLEVLINIVRSVKFFNFSDKI